MDKQWLILADDLTGAADCAVAFGRRGLASTVNWGETVDLTKTQTSVLSYDADSRYLTAEAAAQRHSALLERLLTPSRTFFKKIDSTLRGQPAAETAAVIAHLKAKSGSAFGIFAPAFPATHRTTINGQIMVDGRPLEDTELWRRDHTYASADLGEVLLSAGVTSQKIPLATVRSDALASTLAAIAAKGETVAICDAETEDDLDLIARASLQATPSAFFIGSAGLAHALAAAADSNATAAPLPIAPSKHGTLIVVGSLATVSREGAHKLVATRNIAHIPVTSKTLLGNADDKRDFTAQVIEQLSGGEDALVEIMMDDDLDMSIGSRLADGLAAALAPAADNIGAIAATGGETGSALLSRLGINGIRLVDEIEPGITLGLTLGDLSIPVATKAGAFGDENSLIRIAERLRSVRTKGTFA